MRRHRLGPRLGRFLEGLALVRGVAFDRLDQVGDEVVAPFQLHVDPAPGLVDAVARGDDRVALRDVIEDREKDDRDDDDDGDDHWGSCGRTGLGAS